MNEIMKIENELQVYQPQSLIALAIEKDLGIEKLEKLMELQERWERNEAQKAYTRSVAAFKAELPPIYKTQKAGFKNVSYQYPDLAECMEVVNPYLSKNGLSISWKQRIEANQIIVTCFLTHEMGHFESTELSALADNTGSKNPIQAMGSTDSYLRRYTMFAICGIAARGIDDDGHGHTVRPGPTPTPQQFQKPEISPQNWKAINSILKSHVFQDDRESILRDSNGKGDKWAEGCIQWLRQEEKRRKEAEKKPTEKTEETVACSLCGTESSDPDGWEQDNDFSMICPDCIDKMANQTEDPE